MEPQQIFQLNQEVYFLEGDQYARAKVTGIMRPHGIFGRYKDGCIYYWLEGLFRAYDEHELFPNNESLLEDISSRLI